MVSFSSSSLKRLRILDQELTSEKKYENNLHLVNTNILFQNRHMRCINEITMFNMSKCLNKRKLQLEHSNEQKFLVSGLVTSNGEPWRDGRKIQPDHLV